MGSEIGLAIQAGADRIKIIKMTHKSHKMTGGGHERAQAQASAWVQLLANAVTPHVHAPQLQQQMHQLQNSDAMDVDRGGETSSAQML